MNAGAQCTFLSLLSLGPQPVDSAVHVQGAPFPLFSAFLEIFLETHPQRCVSMVIRNGTRLAPRMAVFIVVTVL